MIITVYADRRTQDVLSFGEALAEAFADATPDNRVLLYIDPLANKPARREHRVTPQRLPANPGIAMSPLREPGPVAIVAIWGPVTNTVVTLFDLAHRIVLLTDASVQSLRATQRTLKLCDGLGYRSNKIVIAGLDDGDGAADDTIASVLKQTAIEALPTEARAHPAARQAFSRLANRLKAG
jgi:hypothetical protein